MPTSPLRFAGLPDGLSRPGSARVALLPAPLERTVSWGRGCERGPEALIAASQQLELWDQELGREPCAAGIATLPPLDVASGTHREALERIGAAVGEQVAAGRFPITVGGEHSVAVGAVRGLLQGAERPPFGVVLFDAHADLRDEYEGSPLSHACVHRRLLEHGLPTLMAGIRSLSSEEAELVADRSLPVVWAEDLAGLRPARWEALLDALPEAVYLSFDVDYFDPALVPGTGTPEPGGGAWHPTLALLRALFARKRVVGMDLVELAPIAGQPAGDFLAAKLVYKCVGYLTER